MMVAVMMMMMTIMDDRDSDGLPGSSSSVTRQTPREMLMPGESCEWKSLEDAREARLL